MNSFNDSGLTLEETGVGSDRMMQTIRLNGYMVASISYNTQTDSTNTEKSGFGAQFVRHNALTESQIEVIEDFIKTAMNHHHKTIFGGQK